MKHELIGQHVQDQAPELATKTLRDHASSTHQDKEDISRVIVLFNIKSFVAWFSYNFFSESFFFTDHVRYK